MIKSKKELREFYKEKRRSLTQKEQKDLLILNNFKQSSLYLSCKSLFVYVSGKIEVDTRRLIGCALKSGKKVACPVCDTNECTIKFYYINSLSELKCGAYGIEEPDISLCAEATADKETVVIVPGLSFDLNGYRLGFGKGYYDRFISSNTEPTYVGLCYSDCICKALPNNEYDKKVSAFVTEEKINFIS